MRHLSRDERLLALDGALDRTRQAHLATCAACRADVDGLRGVVARVRAVDVPEPSPLFWDHLAARVGEAIAREPAPATPHGWWSPRLAWTALAVILFAATAGYLTRPGGEPTTPMAAAVGPAAVVSPPEAPAAPAFDPLAVEDAGWALIAAMADEAEPDETFAPQAGESELSILSLSAEERTALAGELAAELRPAGLREG